MSTKKGKYFIATSTDVAGYSTLSRQVRVTPNLLFEILSLVLSYTSTSDISLLSEQMNDIITTLHKRKFVKVYNFHIFFQPSNLSTADNLLNVNDFFKEV